MLLVPADESVVRGPVRVVWRKGDNREPRAVPAGRYRVKHFAIEREHQGETWYLSASGKQGPTVQIEEAKTTVLKLDDVPDLRGAARWREGKLSVAACPGASRMACTIARGARLIEFKAEVLDADGTVIMSSAMRYG